MKMTSTQVAAEGKWNSDNVSLTLEDEESLCTGYCTGFVSVTVLVLYRLLSLLLYRLKSFLLVRTKVLF